MKFFVTFGPAALEVSVVSVCISMAQVLRLMCAVISHVEGGLNLIFYSDCDCAMEVGSWVVGGC